MNMIKNYWSLFYLSLSMIIIFSILLVLCLVFSKKMFLKYKFGLVLLILCLTICLGFVVLFANTFSKCCKDYRYVINGEFVQVEGLCVGFTHTEIDYDGNGEVSHSNPRFYIEAKDCYIVLNTKEAKQGKYYLIKYYPNTLICEIIEK